MLLDVLEEEGFPNIRSKMVKKEAELKKEATFRKILTDEEIKAVKKVLQEFKVPSPTGWANALYIHAMKDDIKSFSPDRVYDYTGLCNLITSLREAGLSDPKIWCKIKAARDSLKRYEEGS
jgi:hypothetical protein